MRSWWNLPSRNEFPGCLATQPPFGPSCNASPASSAAPKRRGPCVLGVEMLRPASAEAEWHHWICYWLHNYIYIYTYILSYKKKTNMYILMHWHLSWHLTHSIEEQTMQDVGHKIVVGVPVVMVPLDGCMPHPWCLKQLPWYTYGYSMDNLCIIYAYGWW